MRTLLIRRALGTAFGAVLVAGLVAPAALAAPPANDELANARVIASVPFRLTQSTSHATYNPATDTGGYPCMGGHSVWFRFRPTAAVTARVITLGSSYDTLLGVFRGPASHLTSVACSDDTSVGSAVEVQFHANVTYFIAVSSCCDTAADFGGTAELEFYLPKALSSKVRVTTAEAGNVSGRALLSGTFRCTNPARLTVYVTLSERVGSRVARGSAYLETPHCQRNRVGWSFVIDSETGVAFRPGNVSMTVSAYVYDGFGDLGEETTSTIAMTNAPNARSTS